MPQRKDSEVKYYPRIAAGVTAEQLRELADLNEVLRTEGVTVSAAQTLLRNGYVLSVPESLQKAATELLITYYGIVDSPQSNLYPGRLGLLHDVDVAIWYKQFDIDGRLAVAEQQAGNWEEVFSPYRIGINRKPGLRFFEFASIARAAVIDKKAKEILPKGQKQENANMVPAATGFFRPLPEGYFIKEAEQWEALVMGTIRSVEGLKFVPGEGRGQIYEHFMGLPSTRQLDNNSQLMPKPRPGFVMAYGSERFSFEKVLVPLRPTR